MCWTEWQTKDVPTDASAAELRLECLVGHKEVNTHFTPTPECCYGRQQFVSWGRRCYQVLKKTRKDETQGACTRAVIELIPRYQQRSSRCAVAENVSTLCTMKGVPMADFKAYWHPGGTCMASGIENAHYLH
jgi:hypothetical protein